MSPIGPDRPPADEIRPEPFYFGPPGGRLFGIAHPVARAAAGATVLCSPFGHEHIQSHRAYRRLAALLSEAGRPALRFDYYGTGDSAGRGDEARLSRWVADAGTALALAGNRFGHAGLALVGARLGAAVAALAAARRSDVASLVLWDPVARGRTYLSELHGMRREARRSAHLLDDPGGSGDDGEEVLGYPLPAGMVRELQELDLLELERPPARRILVVGNGAPASDPRLVEHLRSLGADVEALHLAAAAPWRWIEDVGSVVVPHAVLQRIAEWAGVGPR